jgi:hypothetical protein
MQVAQLIAERHRFPLLEGTPASFTMKIQPVQQVFPEVMEHAWSR